MKITITRCHIQRSYIIRVLFQFMEFIVFFHNAAVMLKYCTYYSLLNQLIL